MGLVIEGGDFGRVEAKLSEFFTGFAEDMKATGEAAAAAIVQTTLAGIGAGDQPFRPYSPAYQERLNAVGGKPQQTVNLRGLFYHAGYGPKLPEDKGKRIKAEKRLLGKGALRGSYVTVTAGGRTFQARTGITRPQLGLTDHASEMSLDLIKVEATDTTVTLKYEPRTRDYMIEHQKTRPWFSADKAAVQAAALNTLRTALAARVAWFNGR